MTRATYEERLCAKLGTLTLTIDAVDARLTSAVDSRETRLYSIDDLMV